MIRPSVLEKWPAYTRQFEGREFAMYVDKRGLITTGMGNLIDPVSAACTLKWRHANGGLASVDQIRSEWQRLKSFGLAMGDHNPSTQAKLAALTLHLDPADVDELVREKCAANADFMRAHYFPDWDTWPADAQLAALSEAWAAGAGFPSTFTAYTAAAKRQDWIHAANECKSRETFVVGGKTVFNAGVVPRNKNQLVCLRNAAAVAASVGTLDPAVCYWPDLVAGDP